MGVDVGFFILGLQALGVLVIFNGAVVEVDNFNFQISVLEVLFTYQ